MQNIFLRYIRYLWSFKKIRRLIFNLLLRKIKNILVNFLFAMLSKVIKRMHVLLKNREIHSEFLVIEKKKSKEKSFQSHF